MNIPDRLNIADIEPLSGLVRVARELKVEIKIFGGAIGRCWLCESMGRDYDLFDLAPYNSDFDIWHSGSETQSEEVKMAIYEEVKFAPWSRWAIQDNKSGKRAYANKMCSTKVPLRDQYLTSRGPVMPSQELRNDIQRNQISFSRNSEYSKSEFAKNKKDLEFFGLLLALNALADMREISGEGELADKFKAQEWLHSRQTQQELRIALVDTKLRQRLWHKSSALAAKCTGATDIGPVQIFHDFLRIVEQIDQSIKNTHTDQYSDFSAKAFDFGIGLPGLDKAMSSSRPVNQTDLRVNDLTPRIELDNASEKALKILRNNPALPAQNIDPAFSVVAVIENLELSPSQDYSREDLNIDTVFDSWAFDDFVQLVWEPRQYESIELDPRGLTAIIVPLNFKMAETAANSIAVGGVFSDGKKWIRFATDHLSSGGTESKREMIDVIVLQAKTNPIAGGVV